MAARSYDPPPPRGRELQAARDIAHAFLTARRPVEVYRVALGRVAPLVGASFACVFLRDHDPELLRVVAAYNFPQASASYLSTLRVRVGQGPTGRAVEENRLVEAADVRSDPALVDWREAAQELGFTSSVSVPLAPRRDPMGAVTFYFRDPVLLDEQDRNLLRLVADQLAATAEKAHLIDDLERANAQLREQNFELEARWHEANDAKRVKSEFLANISHELRTPLTAILGYAYLLREGHSGTLRPEQIEAVERIEVAGNGLMTLIDDLLDLTHLRGGRTAVQNEACDAVALARAALASLRAPTAEVSLGLEHEDERVPVHTDAGIVLRILQNLLSNAVKFTPRGSIRLVVEQVDPGGNGNGAGPAVLWHIRDTGIGIAPTHLRAIFDEFRQVDGSATRRFGGVGLGLALSQELARRLGGEILLESIPGEGSTFTLAVPVRTAETGLASTISGEGQ